MSYHPRNHEAHPVDEPTPADRRDREPDRSVPHPREALWAARVALLVSVASAVLALCGMVLSLISLCYALQSA